MFSFPHYKSSCFHSFASIRRLFTFSHVSRVLPFVTFMPLALRYDLVIELFDVTLTCEREKFFLRPELDPFVCTEKISR